MTASFMPHGFDHIVHAVHDLDAAADLYRWLGFTVGARNVHPWGTHNRIVQFDRFFIELLTVGEPDKIPAHGAGGLSFGALQRDYLAAREGLSMLLLASDDAAADLRRFDAAGIAAGDLFTFGREGRRPDGSVVKLQFSLAFARDPLSPQAGFASCQHHYPENFWNPAFQAHANGARAATAVVMVADNPTDHHIFLEAFTGSRDLHSSSIGVTASTCRGDIQIVEPVSLRDQYGITVSPEGEGASFVGLRIAADDLDVVERLLQDHNIPAARHVGRLVVTDVCGAILIFERGTMR
ncbi:glyoxalase-like protein [Rhodopseudomonas thermotolerans]|jgi:catechol 2,3-dioxygenase-like lactoylglutathione lyase family enzyme|uniref:Glyoxalase-like protein n=3 Tax=Nitrobacteraceae TaxID=41294 RepID=A0A336JGW9_9BRAD|nr:glyoxalase-like protein [Rhodopseudomonas pentothenatexigens]REG08177.1 glyoxalase-like protein [Rhodopseudomonas thermotolerans]SSW88988.1 glyoxalase-like protein [Rhodopseudomonas pentothenatexigens]